MIEMSANGSGTAAKYSILKHICVFLVLGDQCRQWYDTGDHCRETFSFEHIPMIYEGGL